MPFRPVADIRAVRFEVGAEEREPVAHGTEGDFVGMQRKSELVAEEGADFADAIEQEFPIRVHQDEIVDVTPIITDFQGFLHEPVERMQVEVGKNLAREIADGKPDSRRREKQALVPGKPDPIGPVSLDGAIPGRIVGHDGPYEKPERFRVGSAVFFPDDVLDHGQEKRTVDGHEKSHDVELEYP